VSSWERTRWTIAHEVGHAVLHRSAFVAERETAETAANSFANELLAPIDAVRPELPKMITLLALTDTKARWGLSIGALIKHLYTSRVIDNRRKDTLQAQLYTRHNSETGTTFGKYEPGWKDRTPELPGMLRYWLERTVRTSQPKAVAALMGIWPADLLSQLLDEQAFPAVDRPTHRRARQRREIRES
jgi:Zn-dependent peptidase ImmA (M78 family)